MDQTDIKKIITDTVNIIMEEHKKEVEDLFKKQELAIGKIISANTSIVNDRLAKIENELSSFKIENIEIKRDLEQVKTDNEDLKDSVEFVSKENMEKMECVKEKIKEIQATLSQLKNEHRIQEDRSRRSNLRVDGITEDTDETWEAVECKVLELFKRELSLDNIEIERAHRTGKRKGDGKPRTIILKLLRFKDKERILRHASQLKDTNIYINEDFSQATRDIRRGLWEEVRKLRREGKYAVLQYDRIYQRNFRGRSV